MHAVTKPLSTTKQFRVVFDYSVKTKSGASLNDQLLVVPAVHAPLLDLLLRFRQHKVALTTVVSRMCRAVIFHENRRDIHRFVLWRAPSDVLTDNGMTRLTLGVSASSFAAKMAVKQNAVEHRDVCGRAAELVHTSFYVDNGLTVANSVSEAADLH